MSAQKQTGCWLWNLPLSKPLHFSRCMYNDSFFLQMLLNIATKSLNCYKCNRFNLIFIFCLKHLHRLRNLFFFFFCLSFNSRGNSQVSSTIEVHLLTRPWVRKCKTNYFLLASFWFLLMSAVSLFFRQWRCMNYIFSVWNLPTVESEKGRDFGVFCQQPLSLAKFYL